MSTTDTDFSKFLEKNKLSKISKLEPLQLNKDVIEMGILPFDMAIGWEAPNGLVGMRAGDIIEIFGFPGSLKTAIAEEATVTTLKRFGANSVTWVFAEPCEVSRFNDKNIDLDDVIGISCYNFGEGSNPNDSLAENSLELAVKMAAQEQTRLIVIDSVSALATASQMFENSQSKKARDLDVSPVAALARVFNNFIGQFIKYNKNSVLLLLNHYKTPINTNNYGYVDPNIVTAGGNAKGFMSYVRVFSKCSLLKDDKENKHSMEDNRQSRQLAGSLELIRNKYCNPTNNRSCKIVYDLNTFKFNNEQKAIEYASFFGERVTDPNNKSKKVTKSIIDPPVASSGAWFYIGEETFNGINNAVKYLVDNPEIYDKLKMQLYKHRDTFFLDEKPKVEEIDG